MQAKNVSVTINRQHEIQRMAQRLFAGWAWLDENPADFEFEVREDRWIAWLREYEEVCDGQ